MAAEDENKCQLWPHSICTWQKCNLISNPVPGLSPLNSEEVNKFMSARGEIQKRRNTLPLLQRDHVVMVTMSTSVKLQMKSEREIV